MVVRGISDSHVAPAAIVEEASTASAASAEFLILARETLQLFQSQQRTLNAHIQLLTDRLAQLRLGATVVEENVEREGATETQTRTTFHVDRTEIETRVRSGDLTVPPRAPDISREDNLARFEQEHDQTRELADIATKAIETLNLDLIEPMTEFDMALRGNVVSIQVTNSQQIQYQLISVKFDSLIGGLESVARLAKQFGVFVRACTKLAELTEFAKKWRTLLAPKTLWAMSLPSGDDKSVVVIGASRRLFVVDAPLGAAAILDAHSVSLSGLEGFVVRRPDVESVVGLKEFAKLLDGVQDAWIYLCNEQQGHSCADLPFARYYRPAESNLVQLYAGDRLEVVADHSGEFPRFSFHLADKTITVGDGDPFEGGGDVTIRGNDVFLMDGQQLDISRAPTLIELTPSGQGAIIRRWSSRQTGE